MITSRTTNGPTRELIAGVERELRMPVAAILAAASMQTDTLDPKTPAYQMARLIKHEGHRIQQSLDELAALIGPARHSSSLARRARIHGRQ